MPIVKRDVYQCNRCGHEWLPRKQGEIPPRCAKCKSPYWNRPRLKIVPVKTKDGSFDAIIKELPDKDQKPSAKKKA